MLLHNVASHNVNITGHVCHLKVDGNKKLDRSKRRQ
jgi:hypothetical protein